MPIDFEILPATPGITDTGAGGNNTAALDSIQPMQDGVDPLNAAALNRDAENLRNRTEVLRLAADTYEAIITDNLGLSYALTQLGQAPGYPASVYWDGPYLTGSVNTGVVGSGAMYFDVGSTLLIEPINSPAFNMLAGVVAYNSLVAGETAANGIVLTANWLDVHGSNFIELQIVYSGSATGTSATAALAGGNIIGVPADITGGGSLLQNTIVVTTDGLATWGTVGTAITAAASSLVTVTQTGDWDGTGLVFNGAPFTLPYPPGGVVNSGVFPLAGGADAERHYIPAANLAVLGSPPFVGGATPLQAGDGLAIMFANWDYRRSQVLTQCESFISGATNLGSTTSAYPFASYVFSTTVPAASIVNTTEYPNLIQFAIPLARVAPNGGLVLGNGDILPNPGITYPSSPAPVSSGVGGLNVQYVTPKNNVDLINQTTTILNGNTFNQIQQLANDINGLTGDVLGADLLTGTSPLSNIAKGSIQTALQEIYTDVGENALDIVQTTTNLGSYFTQGVVAYTAGSPGHLAVSTSLYAFINGTYFTPASVPTLLLSGAEGIVSFNGTNLQVKTGDTFNPALDIYVGYWNGSTYLGPGQVGTPGYVCHGGWARGAGQPIKVGSPAGGLAEFQFTSLDDAFAFLESINVATVGTVDNPQQVQELWVYDGATAFGETSGATSRELYNIKIIGKGMIGDMAAGQSLPRIQLNHTNYISLSLFNCIVENVAFTITGSGSPAAAYTATALSTATDWILAQGCRFTDCTFSGYDAGGVFTTPIYLYEGGGYQRSEFHRCTFTDTTDAAVLITDTMGTSSSQAGDTVDYATLFDGCSFENVCTIPAISTPGAAASAAIELGNIGAASVIVDHCHFSDIGGYCISAAFSSGSTGGSNSIHFLNSYCEPGASATTGVVGLVNVYAGSAASPVVFVDNLQFSDTTANTAFTNALFYLTGASTTPCTITNCNIQIQRSATAVLTAGQPIVISNSTLSNSYGGATGNRLQTLIYIDSPFSLSNNNINWGAGSGATWIASGNYLINIAGSGGNITGNTITSTATQTSTTVGSLGPSLASTTATSPLIYLHGAGLLTSISGNTIINGQCQNYQSSWSISPSAAYAQSIMSCGIYCTGSYNAVVSGNIFKVAAPAWTPVSVDGSNCYGSGFGAMAGIFLDSSGGNTFETTISGNSFVGTGGVNSRRVDHAGVYIGGPFVTTTNPVRATITGNDFSYLQNGGVLGWWTGDPAQNDACEISVSGNRFFGCGSAAVVLDQPAPPSSPLFIGKNLFAESYYVSGINVVGNAFNSSFGNSALFATSTPVLTVAGFTNCWHTTFSSNVADINSQGALVFYNSFGDITVVGNMLDYYVAAAWQSAMGNLTYATLDYTTGYITPTTVTTGTVNTSILFCSNANSAANAANVTGNVTAQPGAYDNQNETFVDNYVWGTANIVNPAHGAGTSTARYAAPNYLI